ncbi:MAG: hypothetical protein U1F09_15570, partial [Steroidobacteraceae bacterium]
GERVVVDGAVSTVNGAISMESGAKVAGRLESVNGRLSVKGGTVDGGLKTVSGDILVAGGSRVDGGIRVEKNTGGSWGWGTSRRPSVTIESGAIVNGAIEFEREVDLYVGEGVTLGPITGVPPVRHALN